MDPDRIYASQSNGWFGQLVQRSDDGGKTWAAVGNDFAYQGDVGTHMWYDGSSRPWEFTRIWHLEPSPDEPGTVYAGAQEQYVNERGARQEQVRIASVLRSRAGNRLRE